MTLCLSGWPGLENQFLKQQYSYKKMKIYSLELKRLKLFLVTGHIILYVEILRNSQRKTDRDKERETV